jgi:hypothetical protein
VQLPLLKGQLQQELCHFSQMSYPYQPQFPTDPSQGPGGFSVGSPSSSTIIFSNCCSLSAAGICTTAAICSMHTMFTLLRKPRSHSYPILPAPSGTSSIKPQYPARSSTRTTHDIPPSTHRSRIVPRHRNPSTFRPCPSS